MRHRIAFAAVLCSLIAVQAQAGTLTLNYFGTTADGSYIDGVHIAEGSSFTISAGFQPPPDGSLGPGFFIYQATSLTINVGGTDYTVDDLSNIFVYLVDDTNSQLGGGAALPAVVNADPQDQSGLAVIFGTSTPILDSSSPGSTVFSDPVTGILNNLTVMTTAGELTLIAGGDTIGASITGAAVPEPSAIISALAACSAGALFAARRRRAA